MVRSAFRKVETEQKQDTPHIQLDAHSQPGTRQTQWADEQHGQMILIKSPL